MNSSRGESMHVWAARLLVCGVLGISMEMLAGLPASAAEKGDSQQSRRQKREAISVSDSDMKAEQQNEIENGPAILPAPFASDSSQIGKQRESDYRFEATRSDRPIRLAKPQGESECRFEALLGTAKFRGTKTETEVSYEDKLITYMEPETVFKTVCEDQSGWQICCCRTLFGWRERCVWCERCVERQVPEVVEIERQRVERVRHEINQEVPTKKVEPVVVHSRRPYVKKPTFSWDEPQSVAQRSAGPSVQDTRAAEVRQGF
jgi:hypothetical protein